MKHTFFKHSKKNENNITIKSSTDVLYTIGIDLGEIKASTQTLKTELNHINKTLSAHNERLNKLEGLENERKNKLSKNNY